MSHIPIDAPLTAEVGGLVHRLRAQFDDSNQRDAADMLTALATQLAEAQRSLDNARLIERNVQAVREHEHKRAEAALAQLAERNAELARVTREAEIHRSSAVDNYEKWATSQARIDALTEALEDIAEGMGETSLEEIGRFAPAVARAALTTDKEATT